MKKRNVYRAQQSRLTNAVVGERNVMQYQLAINTEQIPPPCEKIPVIAKLPNQVPELLAKQVNAVTVSGYNVLKAFGFDGEVSNIGINVIGEANFTCTFRTDLPDLGTIYLARYAATGKLLGFHFAIRPCYENEIATALQDRETLSGHLFLHIANEIAMDLKCVLQCQANYRKDRTQIEFDSRDGIELAERMDELDSCENLVKHSLWCCSCKPWHPDNLPNHYET